ncbi:hypothetical protein DSO57_1013310 [Entomophthora muscae]|uniref:Uncharacterized protein n=1 Tax=Entomophthora muscae TaxID=34485 RepID=A0ACC2TGQ2_9FUNG|nr:hypothetical protein DSO57_1013310 [Entomophthora muscae]
MKQLGQAMKAIYGSFVGEKEDMHLRSTDVPRTFESAVAFASGFFPNETTFNISFRPKTVDPLIYFFNHCPLEANITLGISRSDFPLERWLYSVVPELTSIPPPAHGFSLQGRTDIIKCMYCNGRATQTNSTLETIFAASNANFRNIYYDSPYISPRLHRMRAGTLLLEIKQHLLNRIFHKHTPSFNLYSAHDLTLVSLLSAMSIRETK